MDAVPLSLSTASMNIPFEVLPDYIEGAEEVGCSYRSLPYIFHLKKNSLQAFFMNLTFLHR